MEPAQLNPAAGSRRKMDPPFNVTYDWLAENGVDEDLPDRPVLVIDYEARTLTYTSWQWAGPRGWDHANLPRDGQTEARTVTLNAELTTEVREAIAASSALLIEAPQSPAQLVERLTRALATCTDHLEAACGIIANAGGGDVMRAADNWQEAAARWRDQCQNLLADQRRAADATGRG